MFGSVFRVRPARGKKDELLKLMSGRMNARKVDGFVRSYTVESGDDVWVIAVFDSEQKYRANANSPEQDGEYREMRALLDSDPEWHDGEIQEWKP